jgi:hypothetical protein
MVCNGNPRHKGSITLGHVYANALNTAIEHLFWAIREQECMITVGMILAMCLQEYHHQRHHFILSLTSSHFLSVDLLV